MHVIPIKIMNIGKPKGKGERNLMGKNKKLHLEFEPMSRLAPERPFAATWCRRSSTNLRVIQWIKHISAAQEFHEVRRSHGRRRIVGGVTVISITSLQCSPAKEALLSNGAEKPREADRGG
jgi:hypothetical protein